VTIDVKATVVSALIGGPSIFAAVILAAPAMAEPATADPVTPGPVIAVAEPAAPEPVAIQTPAPAPFAVEAPAAAPATPAPTPDGTVPPAAVALTTPPDGVPHLSSLQNLPPGTTDTPPDNQGGGVSYLRDIWHAYQTQEVDGKGALLLLTQRPMDADAVPPPGMSANPTPPTAPLSPAAAPPDAQPVS
jgi:hypothetical protein